MCHSRLPTPETRFSLCASISGNGGQVDRREKSYVFSMLHRKDFSLSAVVAEATSASAIGYGRRRMAKSACLKRQVVKTFYDFIKYRENRGNGILFQWKKSCNIC